MGLGKYSTLKLFNEENGWGPSYGGQAVMT